METGLEGIAAKARRETKLKFTTLCHHVTRELIWKSLDNMLTVGAGSRWHQRGRDEEDIQRMDRRDANIHTPKSLPCTTGKAGLDTQAWEDLQEAYEAYLVWRTEHCKEVFRWFCQVFMNRTFCRAHLEADRN